MSNSTVRKSSLVVSSVFPHDLRDQNDCRSSTGKNDAQRRTATQIALNRALSARPLPTKTCRPQVCAITRVDTHTAADGYAPTRFDDRGYELSSGIVRRFWDSGHFDHHQSKHYRLYTRLGRCGSHPEHRRLIIKSDAYRRLGRVGSVFLLRVVCLAREWTLRTRRQRILAKRRKHQPRTSLREEYMWPR